MQTFEIPEAPLTVPLKRGGSGAPDDPQAQQPHTGSIQFTVNNKAGYGVSGRASVQPQGDAKTEWFAIEGEAQRQFHASGSHVYTVRVQVPPGTPPGRHAFRLRVVNVNDPDNDFAESSVAGFEVAAATGGGGFKWWILLVVLAGLLVVGGIAFAVWKAMSGGGDEVTVPDLVGEAAICTEVGERFAGSLQVVCDAAGETRGQPAGTVLAQDPAPDTVLAEGSTLTLTYDPGVVMPALVTVGIEQATERLQAMGITPVVTEIDPAELDGRALNTVLAQHPQAGEPVSADVPVELEYVKGIKVIRFVDMTLQDALVRASGLGLNLAEPTASNTTNKALDGKVRAQAPGENEVVAPGTPLALTYYRHRSTPPCRVSKVNGQWLIRDCLRQELRLEAVQPASRFLNLPTR